MTAKRGKKRSVGDGVMRHPPAFDNTAWSRLWSEIQRQTNLPDEAAEMIIDAICQFNILSANIDSPLELPSSHANEELRRLMGDIESIQLTISSLSNTAYRALTPNNVSAGKAWLSDFYNIIELGMKRLSADYGKDTEFQKQKILLSQFICRVDGIAIKFTGRHISRKNLRHELGHGCKNELSSKNDWVYALCGMVLSTDVGDKLKWGIESIIRDIAD